MMGSRLPGEIGRSRLNRTTRRDGCVSCRPAISTKIKLAIRHTALLVVLSLATHLAAIELAAQMVPTRVSTVRCARVLDVRTGAISENVVLAIDNAGRIQSVTAGAPPPSGGVEIQSGTCLPGLIDTHTHLLQDFRSDRGGDDGNMLATVATESTARRTLRGAALAHELLRAGVTSVRDLGNAGDNGDVALRDAITRNWIAGPRMMVATRALAPAGGQFGTLTPSASSIVNEEYRVVTGVVEARRATREALYEGADVIKVILNAGPRRMSSDELAEVVAEAGRAGRQVAAHAIGDDVVRLAVAAGVSSVEHAYTIPDDVLRMMATRGTFLVPTDWTTELLGLMYIPELAPADIRAQRLKGYEAREAARTDRLKRAVAAGVRIAFGSDIYYDYPGLSRGEASLRVLEGYTKAGLSALQVLQTATVNAAELLGAADRLGRLEVGCWADIIAVDGDITRDIAALRKVTFVMKGGRVFR
jgi:imidazolonepropionase-like amidohydrolase